MKEEEQEKTVETDEAEEQTQDSVAEFPGGDELPGLSEGRPDIDVAVLRDVKVRLRTLTQKRDTAVNSLQQALQMVEQAKTNSLVLRGRISVYEEAIADIEKQYGVKVQEP